MKARENPFRRECLESLTYRAPGFDWEKLEKRLEQLGGRGAIVGPKGHGKTTLMEQWAARCPGAVYFRIHEGQRRLSESQRESRRASAGHRTFIDSAEQLSWLGWRELRRLVPGQLVITTHRAGRLPTLFECRTSAPLLRELIQELTGTPINADSLWHRHRGNLRDALRELYDATAGSSIPPYPAR